jgi:hypothetical protein
LALVYHSLLNQDVEVFLAQILDLVIYQAVEFIFQSVNFPLIFLTFSAMLVSVPSNRFLDLWLLRLGFNFVLMSHFTVIPRRGNNFIFRLLLALGLDALRVFLRLLTLLIVGGPASFRQRYPVEHMAAILVHFHEILVNYVKVALTICLGDEEQKDTETDNRSCEASQPGTGF